MTRLSKVFMLMVLGVFICLPGAASADFLLSSMGFTWTNNPPAPGPIDRIDTFILAGNYSFSNALISGSAGTVYFSNPSYTGTLINDHLTRATGPSFTGTMGWNYNFAGTNPGTSFTLGLNYYSAGHFVISETWTWNGSSWSGGPSNNPVPLPASVLLLGTGLVGLGCLGFRRKKETVDDCDQIEQG